MPDAHTRAVPSGMRHIQAPAEGGFMDSSLPEPPGFECCFTLPSPADRPYLLGGLPLGWGHSAGSPLAPEDAFSGRVGDGILGSLGEMQPGSTCCLFLVPELQNSIFFPYFCAQCCLPGSDTQLSASNISWLFICDFLHPVQSDFQRNARQAWNIPAF